MSEVIAGALGLGLLGLIIYEIEKKKKEQSQQTQTTTQTQPTTQAAAAAAQPQPMPQPQTITIQPQPAQIEPQTILTNLNQQVTQPPQTQTQTYTTTVETYPNVTIITYKGGAPKIICRPIYTTEISKVLDKLNLNFGYIEFVQAQKFYQPQYCDNTLGEKTPQGDPFYIFYIKYKDPFGFINADQFAVDNIFISKYGDSLEQIKTQWPVYYPERVQNPNYPKLVQDLENIYSFIDKYKNQVNYIETGVNLTQ